ncbi:MAG: hypothetical protein Q8O67_14070 [Deltaproteobacteria bacterium]|nr:hypothetical protein [Deltaproteobacteria bacterium]
MSASPQNQAATEGLRRVFAELKKGIRQVSFNKHRTAEWKQYVDVGARLLVAELTRRGPIALRLEASTLLFENEPVLEDDQRDGNLIYPLWRDAVRQLTFLPGITADELLRFYTVVLGLVERPATEDLTSFLWKLNLPHIQTVVSHDAEFTEGSDGAVEVDADVVIAGLEAALRGTGEGLDFARVQLSDVGLKVDGTTTRSAEGVFEGLASPAERLRFQRMCVTDHKRLIDRAVPFLVEILDRPPAPGRSETVVGEFEQLLDVLLLEGGFGAVDRIVGRAEALAADRSKTADHQRMAEAVSRRMVEMLNEPSRVRAFGGALNADRGDDLSALGRLLSRLGPQSVVMLTDLLATLRFPAHRKILVDVLAESGKHAVPLFAARLKQAQGTLANDLFQLITRLDPPNKAEIFAPLLASDDVDLRNQVMAVAAREGDPKAFEMVNKSFAESPVPQMRANAARTMARFPAALAAPVLLAAVAKEGFDALDQNEQRAVVAALALLNDDAGDAWFRAQLAVKTPLFGKKNIDERKQQAIIGLTSAPSRAHFELLQAAANDTKLHSKDVVAAARVAATKMRAQLDAPPPKDLAKDSAKGGNE